MTRHLSKGLAIGVAAAGLGAFAAMPTMELESTSGAQPLNPGWIYTVSKDVTIAGGAGAPSGLRMTAPGDYVISISNATLNVTGAAGRGQSTPGGAGIELAPGCRLFITGSGKLVATGGAGADGESGENAEDNASVANAEQVKSASGGAGGAGGAGAGAGIGGAGGAGGLGGAGGEQTQANWKAVTCGRDGSSGGGGVSGGGCGQVFVVGDVEVAATAGRAGGGGRGGNASNWALGTGKTYYWAAYAGGGGGGGFGGRGAQSIGGGGGGGAGGGGGGSGGSTYYTTAEWIAGIRMNGLGGAGATVGAHRTSYEVSNKTYPAECKDDKGYPYANFHGGQGGGVSENGPTGASGRVFRSPLASVTAPGCATAPAAAVDNAFAGEKTTISFSTGDVTPQYVGFMQLFTAAEPPKTAKPGYRFAGWWTTSDDSGFMVFDEDGQPFARYNPFLGGAFVLYPHWTPVGGEGLVVNTTLDGENLGGGTNTLRDAVKLLVQYPTLAGTGGLRRITFNLPRGSRVQLTNEIVVAAASGSEAVRKFEIWGLGVDGDAVTLLPASGARLFRTAADIEFHYLNFDGGNPGGGLLLEKGCKTLELFDCAFWKNRADKGGAVAARSDCDATVVAVNCTFYANTGGAVSVPGGNVLAANCTFCDNLGGAIASDGWVVPVNCTFASSGVNGGGNTIHLGKDKGSHLRALNCIFADGEAAVGGERGDASELIHSVVGDFKTFFTGNGPKEYDWLGVRHVYCNPSGWPEAGLLNGAEVFHDASYENIAYQGPGDPQRRSFYGDNPALAGARLATDQLHNVRMRPVMGAIRLARGDNLVSLAIEGQWLGHASGAYDCDAKLLYDENVVANGESAVTRPLKIRTDGECCFSASVELDGSDGNTHNVTSVVITARNGGDHLAPKGLEVVTAPYALVAASAELVVAPEAVAIGGNDNSADEIVVENGVVADEAVIDGDLTAASVNAKRMSVDSFTLVGGSLDWLRGDAGATFATIGDGRVTYGGGEGGGTASGKLATSPARHAWKAAEDGFCQMSLDVDQWLGHYDLSVELSAGGASVTGFQSMTTEPNSPRHPRWTVPVRRGETVTLKVGGTAAAGYRVSCQFIYFGKAGK